MVPCAGLAQEASSSSFSHIPQTTYLLFDNPVNSPAVLKKFREFSQTLAASSDNKHLELSQEQSSSGLDGLIARYYFTC